MTYQHRLKPWPGWAAVEYRTLVRATHLLAQAAKLALHQVERRDSLGLPRALAQLARQVREVELAALRVEAGRQERGQARWPRWAIYALRLMVDDSRRISCQLESTDQRSWGELEQLLTDWLASGQHMELALLSGPPPADNEAPLSTKT